MAQSVPLAMLLLAEAFGNIVGGGMDETKMLCAGICLQMRLCTQRLKLKFSVHDDASTRRVQQPRKI
jgi:hypothetical protein